MSICPRCKEREREPNQGWCNPCVRDYRKERYHADPDFRQSKLDASKRYRLSHKEKVKESFMRWKRNNYERRLVTQRKRYAMIKTNGQFSELV